MMMILLAGLRAWQALALPVSAAAPGTPAPPGPEFDRSVAGEEDPGASVDLPPQRPAWVAGSLPCPVCRGKGVGAGGGPCPRCQGRGTLKELPP